MLILRQVNFVSRMVRTGATASRLIVGELTVTVKELLIRLMIHPTGTSNWKALSTLRLEVCPQITLCASEFEQNANLMMSKLLDLAAKNRTGREDNDKTVETVNTLYILFVL